jgi:polyhydroxyalkanoate synthesis regulator phasin|tara:strand:+ start:944 stop:1174 length:231 start_codon:yes stop_codon:yes gene_type:complete
MSQNEVTKAIFSILEKELKNINKLIPGDLLKNLEKNIAPELNNVIEKSGYVSKSKYDSLNKIAKDLEKRISDLEKD